jgi:hypothetical protein
MLPFGLEVKANHPIKKIPMRLGIQSLEDKMKHFYKMLNIEQKEVSTRKRKTKKNKTKKL